MELNNPLLKASQPALFELENVHAGIVELFPAVWSAAEGLVSFDSATRRKALDYLAESGAARLSPVVVHLLASHLTDADEIIRCRTIQILASVLTADATGAIAATTVRQTLVAYLSNMRTRQIYSLLLVVQKNPELLQPVSKLLYAAPYAGTHLSDIAMSRKSPLEIRRLALQLIGMVGYLDAVPALERMLQRGEARVNGQQSMPFAAPTGVDDTGLLPDIKAALALLATR